MLYPIIAQIIIVLVIMGLLASGVNENKDVQITYEKIKLIYPKEIYLKNAVNEYILAYNKFPVDVNSLKNKFIIAKEFKNDNGFGSKFTFELDKNDKHLKIMQTINNEKSKTIYLNHYIAGKEGIVPTEENNHLSHKYKIAKIK
jgi:hypothetical protein